MMCLIWSDHVDKWSAKDDGMINIFCNDNVLREMSLLKIEAWVLPAIYNFELLTTESFSEVFCKNCFETTPSLIQFKSAPTRIWVGIVT